MGLSHVDAGAGNEMAASECVDVITTEAEARRFDLTLSVGCSLGYEVTGGASLLLNLQPRSDRSHAVVFEA